MSEDVDAATVVELSKELDKLHVGEPQVSQVGERGLSVVEVRAIVRDVLRELNIIPVVAPFPEKTVTAVPKKRRGFFRK